jgi:hypothetical protein
MSPRGFSRRAPRELGRVERFAAVMSIGQVAWALRQRWQELPPGRRSRLQTLVRQSAGRPSNLSAAERRELWSLVGELRLGEVVRQGALRGASRRGLRLR